VNPLWANAMAASSIVDRDVDAVDPAAAAAAVSVVAVATVLSSAAVSLPAPAAFFFVVVVVAFDAPWPLLLPSSSEIGTILEMNATPF